MNPVVTDIILRAPFRPYSLPNIAARYDLNDLASLDYDGSNRLKLASDLSGNSAVNGLVLNAVSGNYASTPATNALKITGDIDIRVWLVAVDWTPAATKVIISRYVGSNASYEMSVTSAGVLNLVWSEDGSALKTRASTVTIPFSDLAGGWVRATLDVDNGASGHSVIFYTSADGVAWTQLGTTVTTAGVTSIFAGTAPLEIGSDSGGGSGLAAIFYRAQIYNGIAGTLVFDADFTAQAKLAGSFTESSVNAATVTINASGDTGAHIGGARDLYQATSGKKAILTQDALGNYATFDGVNDFLKTAAFALSQPTTVYFVGTQISWTNLDTFYDGTSSANRMALAQDTSSPNIGLYAASSNVAGISPTLNARFVASSVFNAGLSTNRLNNSVQVTGNPGADSANGFTLGSWGQTDSFFSNITFSEALIFSAAHNEATQLKIAGYLMRKWKIS